MIGMVAQPSDKAARLFAEESADWARRYSRRQGGGARWKGRTHIWSLNNGNNQNTMHGQPFPRLHASTWRST